MGFAENLKRYRKLRGISRQTMADKLKMLSASYAKYELNIAKPDTDKLKIIANMLDVSADKLLGIKNKPADEIDEVDEVDEFDYCKSIWESCGYTVEEDFITGMVEIFFNSKIEKIVVENGKVEKKVSNMLPLKDREEFIKLTQQAKIKANNAMEKAQAEILKNIVQSSTYYIEEKDGMRSYFKGASK